jgi:hypothetical protein
MHRSLEHISCSYSSFSTHDTQHSCSNFICSRSMRSCTAHRANSLRIDLRLLDLSASGRGRSKDLRGITILLIADVTTALQLCTRINMDRSLAEKQRESLDSEIAAACGQNRFTNAVMHAPSLLHLLMCVWCLACCLSPCCVLSRSSSGAGILHAAEFQFQLDADRRKKLERERASEREAAAHHRAAGHPSTTRRRIVSHVSLADDWCFAPPSSRLASSGRRRIQTGAEDSRATNSLQHRHARGAGGDHAIQARLPSPRLASPR